MLVRECMCAHTCMCLERRKKSVWYKYAKVHQEVARFVIPLLTETPLSTTVEGYRNSVKLPTHAQIYLSRKISRECFQYFKQGTVPSYCSVLRTSGKLAEYLLLNFPSGNFKKFQPWSTDPTVLNTEKHVTLRRALSAVWCVAVFWVHNVSNGHLNGKLPEWKVTHQPDWPP